MPSRIIDLGRMTSERLILKRHIEEERNLNTEVQVVSDRGQIPNQVGEDVLGLFRPATARKAVIGDLDTLRAFEQKRLSTPSFLEAGPRSTLRHDPRKVRVAIVTTGGLAPGLHVVMHSIVKRHSHTYRLDMHGKVFGIYNGFKGLCHLADNQTDLSPDMTEEWLGQGGSKLGSVRYYHTGQPGEESILQMVDVITTNLKNNSIDILYVIGGDGSLKVAHQIALANPGRSVVGIPKTMDNDILWVWQSFGFNTAVEQAALVVNTLHSEAESTRRICIIELFGADSGFVAANASLASGHVNLVLIPEVFNLLDAAQAQAYLDDCINHIGQTVQGHPHSPHAVVVVAEGVGAALEKNHVSFEGVQVHKEEFVALFEKAIKRLVVDAHGLEVPVFVNQPRHYIRAVPANAHDHIYCERLGTLAVDNALAGYTDFMVSQWQSEFVLVPLHLVEPGKKSIPVNGMFWKQVVSSTGQPLSDAEHPARIKQESKSRQTTGIEERDEELEVARKSPNKGTKPNVTRVPRDRRR
jgi:6-phosphofructokinase 1